MCKDREGKRKKIIEAAYQLFIEKGYKDTKIIDIAVSAGIGKGTVYEYFDSKEALFLDIISGGMEEYLAECRQVVETEMDSQLDKLLQMIQLETKYSKENGPRMMKLSLLVMDSTDGLPKGFLPKMQGAWKEKYRYMKEILDKGVEQGEFRKLDTSLAAIAIIGCVGTCLNMKYGIGQLDCAELPFDANSFKREELINLILKGIQA